MKVLRAAICIFLFTNAIHSIAQNTATIPGDFPSFIVPGHEKEMETMRQLYWHHYPGAGPKATLWDEWLTSPSLWPAVETNNMSESFREQWRATLTGRIMDKDGYVATHQHQSIAHQLGWPFPFWAQGTGGWGWHFALPGMDRAWTGTDPKTQEGWSIENGADNGIANDAWNVSASAPHLLLAPPPMKIDTLQSPFLQLRWRAKGIANAQPYVEWTREDAPEFSPDRRYYFDPVESESVVFTMIPVYKHPEWKGAVMGMRLQFNNGQPSGEVGIQGFFTQYDTRHTINNANFVRGCAKYFGWTHDYRFLREQIDRMRVAIRYVMEEFKAKETGLVICPWVGHDGRSGIVYDAEGKKTLRSGFGVGNNYWDLMPMGHKDAYATIQYYDAVNALADVEQSIANHPEWGVHGGALAFTPDELKQHAQFVRDAFNKTFWNSETRRFACSIDIDDVLWDYGFTFLNAEAIYFGIASPEYAEQIEAWMCGDRMVEGDTSQGADIYHWRFGPRSTTKRNVDYYLWAWSNPESIVFGNQVQDGGAVMGFAFHDLMARLAVRGPDSVVERLDALVKWFDEVQAVGGYRKYYDGTRDGTMQGAGIAGGLGLDNEFFESVMTPQIMSEGFMGIRATPEYLVVAPKLPAAWPEFTITNVRYREAVFDIRAARDGIELTVQRLIGLPDSLYCVEVPYKGVGLETISRDPAKPISEEARQALQVIGNESENKAYPNRSVLTFPPRPGTTVHIKISPA
jgi:hypothetical protein